MNSFADDGGATRTSETGVDRIAISGGEIGLDIPGGLATGVCVTVGIWPGHLATAEGDGDLEGRVEQIDSETHLYATASGPPQLCICQEGQSSLQRGDAGRLGARRDRIDVLDQSGAAIGSGAAGWEHHV